MFAIYLDENGYLKAYSDRRMKPGCIITNMIPEESNIEKMRCYKFIDGDFVFDADKWAEIEKERTERERIAITREQIANLKSLIEELTKQIIECVICLMLGKSFPHDIKDIYTKQTKAAAEIAELEKTL